jgi:putative transposase
MNAIETLSVSVGTRAACSALNAHRSRDYRNRQPKRVHQRPAPPSKLSDAERQRVHDVLVSPAFVDQALATVAANLSGEGVHLCSVRTMYRILHERNQFRERRRGHQRTHYAKPELVATAPKQCWSHGSTFICTSFWICSVAMWWAGWWLIVSQRYWPNS